MNSQGFRDRLAIKTQYLVAQVFAPLTYALIWVWLRVVQGYRIRDLRGFRKKLDLEFKKKKGPLLICPNHLTLIDSLILIWAMGSGWRILLNPILFPWNTPEKKNFNKNLVLTALCYIGKCLPVVRRGPQEDTRHLLDQLKRLFELGQSVMIFPEGSRSRTGRVDTENVTYGIGRILEESRKDGLEPKVLCLYLRGSHQNNYSSLPQRNEDFYVDFQIFKPQSPHTGLRASRDLATQIIQRLSVLEGSYFASKSICRE